MIYRRGTIRERVYFKIGLETPDGCWPWEGATIKYGYGRVWRSEFEKLFHSSQLAHRVVYELEGYTIPEGMELDHLCRNPNCVNPDHLEPVTHRTNVRRGNSPIGKHHLKTHCAHGHPYDDENTYHMPNVRS